MRFPNGYGSVHKLSGKRRKPFIAKKTIGFNDKGHPIYQPIGYYEKREQAILALAEFNKNPLAFDNNTITFEEVFRLWKSVKHDEDTSKSTVKIAIEEKYIRFRNTNGSIALVPIKNLVSLSLSAAGAGKSDIIFIGLGTELARVNDLPVPWAEESLEWICKELNL